MAIISWRNVSGFAAATAGALALSASPASAAPTWQPWVAPANYQCGNTTTHSASVNIKMQTCIIKNPSSNYFQAVAIVVNNASVSVNLEAAVFQNPNTTSSVYDICPNKAIAPNTRVACFGRTIANSAPVKADSYITLNTNYGAFTDTATYR
ncbi:hypothetical protein [Streptomyces galbus]|uniref:Secreted protein n=1 Tax=Streptomyces galbus TaxID=33898 RepID=A0A4U5W9A2_STRGB|nr:hypothetical protein [Streptomyces galbus]TKS98148.1 hypothetical protein E4U92_31385 [Streptomyces galbus]GHD43994.1 hypothetical protein GCM10010335_48250 [Streptomyces galbus]